MNLSNGTIIQNRYEVLQSLGEGGMGAVYKVRQLDADRVIALKLLHSISLTDDDSVKRFHREAKALAHLRHEHIVNFLHFGFLDDGAPFAALEFLAGKDLSAVLRNEHLSITRTIKIIKQILEALSFSHSEGVVHRDLKPANIILQDQPESDYVKIVDFGLAKLVTGKESARLTSTGLLIGSVHYMSPEQSRGLSVDARSDIYSCSCILFEMLTGQKPFDADSPIGILYKQTNESAPSFMSTPYGSACSGALEAICRKGMEKNPDDRYQNTAEMLRDIDLWESGQGDSITAGKSAAVSLSVKRLAQFAGLIVAVLALGVAGPAVFLRMQKEDAKVAVPIQTSAERREIGADREIRRMNRTVAAYRRDLALAKNKDDKQEAYTKLAYELSWLGRVETEAGRFDDALKHLDEALKTSVNCGELAKHEGLRALILRGRCYLQSARYPEADRDFLEAISCAKSEFGEETKQWQDVTMHRMVLKAHRRQFQDIDADLAVLRQSWERNRDTNPKTATGRYQSITMGGPSRIDLLLETMTVLFHTSCSSNADIAARLRSMLAMIETIHICDRVSERKWLLLILKDLQKIPRTDPAVAKLIAEFESLPEARSL